MAKTDPPRVHPVRRYPAPQYPSHTDPDPSQYPAPVPFPFSPKLIPALAGMGLLATPSTSGAQDKPNTQPPDNPFTFELSGLPHQTSPFGTGQPSYLEDKVARDVIDKVFREAGFPLQPDSLYKQDGVSVRLDGYDPQKKVGYVFARYSNLEDDAIVKWWKRSDFRNNGEIDLREIEWISKGLPDELVKEGKGIQEIKDPEQRKLAYQAFLEKLAAHRLSLPEIHVLEEKGAEKKEFIAVISQYDRRFVYEAWANEDMSEFHREIERINKLEDPVEKSKALAAANSNIRMKVANDALANLEKCVRQYIAWARSQGLQ